MFKGERIQSSQLLGLSTHAKVSASLVSLLLFQALLLGEEADHCRSVAAPSRDAAQGRRGRFL